jgi:hypothetical protein
MNFPNSYKKMLLAVHATFPFLDAGSNTTYSYELEAGQVGLLNPANNRVMDLSSSNPDYGVTSGNTAAPTLEVCQGSLHTVDKLGPFHGGYQHTVRSKAIDPRFVTKFWVTLPKAALPKILTAGSAEPCDFMCNTTYSLRLDLKGSPVLRTHARNFYKQFDYFTGCCTDPETPTAVDQALVYEGWMNQILTDSYFQYYVLPRVLYTVTNSSGTVIYKSTTKPNISSATNGRVAAGPVTITTAGSGLSDLGTPVIATSVVGATLTGMTVLPIIEGGVLVDMIILNPGTLSPHATVGTSTATFTDAITGGTAVATITNTAVASGLNWDTVATDEKYAQLLLQGAYSDTTFSTCSFDRFDHVELAPLDIYASFTDLSGETCAVTCNDVEVLQYGVQSSGDGETIIREYILDRSYEQESWSQDTRTRDVLDNTILTNISRTGKYYSYNILYNVPRNYNPSSLHNDDQYHVQIICATRQNGANAFEAAFNNYLSTANSTVRLEVL